MTAIRNFLLIGTTAFGAWLLWRINGAIGDQALLLVFGIVIGLACMACAAVIGLVIAQVRRDDRPEIAPQAPMAQQFAPPVIVFLGDGSRHGESPYQAPAGLFAPPAARQIDAMPAAAARPMPFRVVGENEAYVVEEWVRS